MFENRKCDQKSKISSKIENFVKNIKFGKNRKISSKIEHFVKTRKFRQTRLLTKFTAFLPNEIYEILLKNPNLGQK